MLLNQETIYPFIVSFVRGFKNNKLHVVMNKLGMTREDIAQELWLAICFDSQRHCTHKFRERWMSELNYDTIEKYEDQVAVWKSGLGNWLNKELIALLGYLLDTARDRRREMGQQANDALNEQWETLGFLPEQEEPNDYEDESPPIDRVFEAKQKLQRLAQLIETPLESDLVRWRLGELTAEEMADIHGISRITIFRKWDKLSIKLESVL